MTSPTKQKDQDDAPLAAAVLTASVFGYAFLRFNVPVPPLLPEPIVDLIVFMQPALLPLGLISPFLVFFGLRHALGHPNSPKNRIGLMALIAGGLPAILLAVFMLAEWVRVGFSVAKQIGYALYK